MQDGALTASKGSRCADVPMPESSCTAEAPMLTKPTRLRGAQQYAHAHPRANTFKHAKHAFASLTVAIRLVGTFSKRHVALCRSVIYISAEGVVHVHFISSFLVGIVWLRRGRILGQ